MNMVPDPATRVLDRDDQEGTFALRREGGKEGGREGGEEGMKQGTYYIFPNDRWLEGGREEGRERGRATSHATHLPVLSRLSALYRSG